MIEFSRHFSMPSPWTFTLKPVAALLEKYGAGKNWIDPFAGENSPAEFTNDLNPVRKAKFHMQADYFVRSMPGPFDGLLFDPPYSYRQITEHYKILGIKATQLDTSANFYKRVKDAAAPKLRDGGISISFGWNSVGLGKKRGFEVIEILLMTHGSNNNDTIVTVEKKIK